MCHQLTLEAAVVSEPTAIIIVFILKINEPTLLLCSGIFVLFEPGK